MTLCLNVDTGVMMTMKEMRQLHGEEDEVWRRRVQVRAPIALTRYNYSVVTLTQVMEREIIFLRRSRCANVVKYLGTEVKEGVLRIFMEYVPGGTLRSVVQRFGSLDEATVSIVVLLLIHEILVFCASG
jgi:serine/threonine protein kinase